MQLTYELTLADYKAALRLHRRQKLNRRIAEFVWFRFMPIICSMMLVFELFMGFTQKTFFSQNPPGLLVVPLVFLLLPAIRSRFVRSQFNQLFSPSARNLSIDIDDERIVCVNPGSSESRFLWHIVLEFAQDEKITMLYIHKLRFLFFPTSAMSVEQRAELNDLVARHVTKRKP
jgi:hypothetical protein